MSKFPMEKLAIHKNSDSDSDSDSLLYIFLENRTKVKSVYVTEKCISQCL